MTHSFTRDGGIDFAGKRKRVTGQLDITSYNNGGESITASDIPGIHSRIDAIFTTGASDTGHLWEWDDTNGNINAYTFDYDATTDGTAIEESNGTDVGAMTVEVVGV